MLLFSISFSDDENTAFPVNYLTAWVALMKIARLKSNDTVLIHAAAGGVGTAAVQIAKKIVQGSRGDVKVFEIPFAFKNELF